MRVCLTHSLGIKEETNEFVTHSQTDTAIGEAIERASPCYALISFDYS